MRLFACLCVTETSDWNVQLQGMAVGVALSSFVVALSCNYDVTRKEEIFLFINSTAKNEQVWENGIF